MFTVKATYRQETRKIKFNESIFFPSYAQINEQLHRIFPLTSDYTLSRLLFSPDASKPDARILIAAEVKNAEDYQRAINPLEGRASTGGLLKFTVVEEDFHKVPRLAVCDAPSWIGQSSSIRPNPGPWSGALSLYAPPVVHSPASVIPPPPIIFSTPPVARGLPLPTPSPALKPTPMDIDGGVGDLYPTPQTSFYNPSYNQSRDRANNFSPHAQFRGTQSQLHDENMFTSSTSSTSSCCSTSQAKSDVQSLLNTFKDDLDRMISDNFGSRATPMVGTPPPEGSAPAPWPEVPTAAQIEESLALPSLTPQVSTAMPTPDPIPIRAPTGDREATPTPAELPVHRGVICDNCVSPVVGIRHKCLDCPDYDLCTPCIRSGSAEAHNPFHEFFEITEPGRVVVHTVYSGAGERDATPSAPRATDPSVSTAPVHTQSQPAAHNAVCNLCDSKIYGDRYKCANCPDFDACHSCFAIVPEQHPDHSFVKIRDPADYIIPRGPRPAEHYATCDSCNRSIRGVRYKCMHADCHDFDLCEVCEALPISTHDPNHPMLKIKTSEIVIPRVYRTGQVSSSGCTRGLSGCHREESSQPSPIPPMPPTVAPAVEVVDAAPPSPVRPPAIHRASCNMCESRIYGDRYKCLNCPDFDTCSTCFEITVVQHPRHGFVKISNPHDLMIRDALALDVMHHASCDSCRRTIYGTRWKCMHPECPDYDLCDSCKAHPIPVHPPRHPMLQMITYDTVIPTVYRVGKINAMPDISPPPISPLGCTLPVVEDPPRPSLASLISELVPKREIADVKTSPPAVKDTQAPSTDDTHEFMTPVLTEKELMSSSISAQPLLVAPTVPEMVQSAGAPVTTHMRSLAALLNGYSSPSATPASTLAESVSSLDLSQGVATPALAQVEKETTATVSFKASFVEDLTVPDGQVLPPGAEFVKSWRVKNDGTVEWPSTSELHFTGGEKMTPGSIGPTAIHVGSLSPGAEVDIWTGELKAPETAGNYRNYWHLSDGQGNLFGHLLWIDINVAQSTPSDSSESSMASSIVMMPQSAASAQSAPSEGLQRTATLHSELSKVSTDDTISEAGSVGSSVSLISVPSSEEDRDTWHNASSLQNTRGADFVVVYASSDEE